ncbi:MAG: replication restart helicase PriA [Candidatus Acidulodesulfobacterium sp.]
MTTAEIVIPKSGTDIKFTYIIPDDFENEAETGRAALVPLKNRTVYGFIYDVKKDDDEKKEHGKLDKQIKLKNVLRISKASFFTESRKDIFNFLASYYHENISGVFDAVLPSLDLKRFDLLDKYFEEAESFNHSSVQVSKQSDECRKKNNFDNLKSERQSVNGFLSKAGYELTKDQENAINLIKESISDGFYKTFLIHGVTASGKTEVYFNLIDYVLSLNKQIIITVPEIFITNQFVYLIKKRFENLLKQNAFAVFHSKISKKEKLINHIRIMNGDVKLILGARSSVFSPLKNPGLIIIDEEHDGSYKQQSGLLYNARDVAVMIAKKTSSVCILGSATPSLESYYNASVLKKYEYIYIKNRVKGKTLPDIELINLKSEFKTLAKKEFKDKILSEETIKLITENIAAEKQVLLFLNRRGFSTFLICTSCGHQFLCKNCAISLVYHKHKNGKKMERNTDISREILECHYCGYKEKVPKLCPECGMDTIEPYGIGVQKLEEHVRSLFSNYKNEIIIERIDSDIAKKSRAGAEIFKKMREKKIDILIGTQIIAKGHDFPNVGLVVVIFADSLLNLPDFRSAEKAFQILTQVAGRAGRGSDKGKIAVQTFIPDNYLLRHTAAHDIKGFYEKELEIRKEYGYPPYSRIIALKLTDKNIETLRETALNLKKSIENIIGIKIKSGDFSGDSHSGGISILGPSPCPIEKIDNEFRYQLILKSPPPAANLHKLVSALKTDANLFKSFSSRKIAVDVDPDVLM